ncbi:hypothetical protein [Ferrimonas kyonanensis]|uniref:hypothetical protein n=1 Tax=Ferrimonas kyonanensis TaxID=364763 RepID=UPI0004231A74|nr:hypothetical protein [Ferrimonas kyonanensis]
MYIFENTEINNKKASDFETKSMLYLLGMREDSAEVDIITVDCFNDVTAANESFSKMWDVQSKNHKSLYPRKIGESLITLYDNYVSIFNFFDYILFVPKLTRTYLNDESLHVYGYENIADSTAQLIEQSLAKKICKKHGTVDEKVLGKFLSTVTFVEDTHRNSTYIKNLSRFKNKSALPEKLYSSIFDELRDIQSALKNTTIEGSLIHSPAEVLKFERHLRTRDIYTLLISRLMGAELFSSRGIPTALFSYVSGKFDNGEDIADFLQECESNLSRAFFDKNSDNQFWKVCEFIIDNLKVDCKVSAENLYGKLVFNVKVTSHYLNQDAIMYLIALAKDGFSNES